MEYASLVVNGTVALEIALKALQIPRGSMVIVPDLSFIATATALANCGMIPIYADISETYFGLTLESVRQKYRVEVKAIVVVHLGGYVNRQIEAIRAFCDEKKIALIEDCAQSLPCRINGKSTGTFGHVGTFSFQSSKIIDSGEGGLVITSSEELYHNIEAITNWGIASPGASERLYTNPVGNYRLSAIQCHLLTQRMVCIKTIINERMERVKTLETVFLNGGLSPVIVPSEPHILDCPFYFMVKSLKKVNTFEPRSEYPMRKSTFVKSILKNLFPDLFEKYLLVNPDNLTNPVADYVLSEIDFINIKQTAAVSPKRLLYGYLGLEKKWVTA